MSANIKCPQCGGEMKNGSQLNQFVCSSCGKNIILKMVEDVSHNDSATAYQQVVETDGFNQQPTQNIKIEVVMPKSQSFIGRLKENNRKLLKISIFVSIAIAVFVSIGKYYESILIENINIFNPSDINSRGVDACGSMVINYLASFCLGLYLILLIIGSAIVKRNKSKEEIKKLSLTYPSKKLQLILFSIFVALPMILILLA